MTEADTARLVAMVRMIWPSTDVSIEITRLWHTFLDRFALADVEAAVRELAVEGNSFAPTIGQLVAKVSERIDTAPDADEARMEFFRLLRRYSHDNPPPAAAYSHPLFASFYAANNNAYWREWCVATDGDRTFVAQQRDTWNAYRNRIERERRLGLVNAQRPTRRALPTPAAGSIARELTAAGHTDDGESW